MNLINEKPYTKVYIPYDFIYRHTLEIIMNLVPDNHNKANTAL